MEEKDVETKRLQDEVEQARRRQTEATEALVNVTTKAVQHSKMNEIFEHEQDEENEQSSNGNVSKRH